MDAQYEYLRDIVIAAEEVGAYIVGFGPGERPGLCRVVLEWPGNSYTRITVEDIGPAAVIRRLGRIGIREAVPA